MSFTHALSTNNYGPAKYIVSANAYEGTHTTIAAALTSASSGDTIFIRPGTYTENLTLKAGVNLSAYPCDAYAAVGQAPNVIILGKATATFTGNCAISGIQLKTNSDFCLAVTGTNATDIQLKGCFIDANNNTAISYTTSSGSSKIELYDCKGNLETTGIAYFAHSGAGAIKFYGGDFENNGGSSTASTNSSSTGGSLSWYGVSYWNNAYTSTNNSLSQASNSQLIGAFIVSGATDSIANCSIQSGTASAISVSTGGTLTLANCTIDSTNTNAITGAGTIKYSGVSFTNTSSTINTTTQTPNYMNLGKWKASGQPCFQAYLNSNQTNKTGDGTTYTIIFDTVSFDQSSNYNNSTGTFTAPVTGKYLLCAYVQGSSLSASFTEILVSIVTTAATYGFNAAKPSNFETNSGSSTLQIGGSIIANMTANDTATVTIIATGSTKTVGVFAGRGSTNFSGCLIA